MWASVGFGKYLIELESQTNENSMKDLSGIGSLFQMVQGES